MEYKLNQAKDEWSKKYKDEYLELKLSELKNKLENDKKVYNHYFYQFVNAIKTGKNSYEIELYLYSTRQNLD
jgi:hypothetical protein